MSDDRKDLPPVNAPNFNERLRETISTYLGNRGNKLDRGLTLRDLVEANIIKLRDSYLAGSGGGTSPVGGAGTAITDAYEPDLTPPPTPTGFSVDAAISNIFITHDGPTYTQGHGHASTVVYGATWVAGTGAVPNPKPTFANAVKITGFSGSIFSHPTNPATVWHLWIKWKSVDGVESASPAGGTNGQVAETGQDVSQLVEAMTGPGNPFTVLTEETVIDGVTFPAGTYSTRAFIDDLQVTQAKIKSVKADSIKAGVLQAVVSHTGAIFNGVNAYTMTTDPITGVVTATYAGKTPGTTDFGTGYYLGTLSGAPQFFVGSPTNHMLWNGSSLTVRGTVYATAGKIGGNTIDSTGMQSPEYALNSSGWRLDSNGSFYAKTGTFSGSLSGANISGSTGTFSGLLTGADITGTTGTFSGKLTAGAVDFASSIGTTKTYVQGTHTLKVPAGMPSMRVLLIGGGGGGGGGTRTDLGHSGGGGGAGGRRFATFNNLAIGREFTLVVGGGGTGGAVGGTYWGGPGAGTPGTAGSETRINGLTSAGGGGGGAGGMNGYYEHNFGAAAAGGVGGTGDSPGDTGESGPAPGYGGAGASVPGYGTGGAPSVSGASAGTGYGSGGAGGSSHFPGGNYESPGASGAPGYAVIEFFDSNGVVLRLEMDNLKNELRSSGAIL